jgi:hypothetical protein
MQCFDYLHGQEEVATALRKIICSVVERTAKPRERAGSPLQKSLAVSSNGERIMAAKAASTTATPRLILLGEERVADRLQLFLLGFVHVREGKMELVEGLNNR